MKYLLCAALFGASFLLAQNPEDIIQTDSVTIYRVHPGYKFLRSKLPKGALYLPRLDQKRVTRQTALLTSGLVVSGIGMTAIGLANTDHDEWLDIHFLTVMGTIPIIEGYIVAPSTGSLKYQDKKRALWGMGMRLGGLLLLMNSSPDYDGRSQYQQRQMAAGIGLGGCWINLQFCHHQRI
jgi:hypothetical protein